MQSDPNDISSGSSPVDPLADGQTICFCHYVNALEIRVAIRAGADTVAKIQAETLASTGCGGCQCEVEDILAEELRIKAIAPRE